MMKKAVKRWAVLVGALLIEQSNAASRALNHNGDEHSVAPSPGLFLSGDGTSDTSVPSAAPSFIGAVDNGDPDAESSPSPSVAGGSSRASLMPSVTGTEADGSSPAPTIPEDTTSFSPVAAEDPSATSSAPAAAENLDDVLESLVPSVTPGPTGGGHKKSPTSAPTPATNTLFSPTPTVMNVKPSQEQYVDVPTNFDSPNYKPPISREEPTVDDEFKKLEEEAEEILEDRNVALVAAVLGGVAMAMLIFVAQQMIENPDGCCARACKCTVACLRILFWPIRALFCCGSRSQSRRTHTMLNDDPDGYAYGTHDLELT